MSGSAEDSRTIDARWMVPIPRKDAICSSSAGRTRPSAARHCGAEVQRDECTCASKEFDTKSRGFRVPGQGHTYVAHPLFRAIGRRFMRFRGDSVSFSRVLWRPLTCCMK
jgi:hypothetical protein